LNFGLLGAFFACTASQHWFLLGREKFMGLFLFLKKREKVVF